MKLDRKRAHKGSNEDWVNPHDPEASITKLKDGRTHLAYKAEHAVDLETGAVVAVTVATGDAGDTATILETLPEAGEHIAEVTCASNNEEVGERVHPQGPFCYGSGSWLWLAQSRKAQRGLCSCLQTPCRWRFSLPSRQNDEISSATGS